MLGRVGPARGKSASSENWKTMPAFMPVIVPDTMSTNPRAYSVLILSLALLLHGSLAQAQSQLKDRPKQSSLSASTGARALNRGQARSPNGDPLEILVTDLRETGTRIAELRQGLRTASGDSRALLLPELAEVRTRYRRELVNASASLADEKLSPTSKESLNNARADVDRRLRTEGALIEKELQSELRHLVSLIARVDKATAEDRPDAEASRNASAERTPLLLGEMAANLKARETLGNRPNTAHTRLKIWLGQSSRLVGAALHSISEQTKLLQEPSGEQPNPDVAKHLSALLSFQSRIVSLQRKNLALMDGYGMNTTQYRQELITTTGEVSEDILNVGVLAGLIAQGKDAGIKWMMEKASVVAFRLISFLVIVFLFLGLARIGRGLAKRAVARAPSVSSLAGEFFVKMAGRSILVVGLVIAAGQAGFQVGPVLAGLGIAGFVLGFALQDILSNFASGMMILMYRPFDVGDVIEAAGAHGTVKAMNLVSTSVLTFDNQMLLVPNNKIWGGVVRNVTHQSTRRVDLSFGIAYSDDIDHAEQVLCSIVAETKLVLKDPVAIVRLHELADSSVNFVVRPWVKTEDYWSVYWSITREVKRRFDAEGLSFPFPQRDVHVYEEGSLDRRQRNSDIVSAMPPPKLG